MFYKVNAVDGMKLYEELLDSSEVANLVSLANDLLTTGRNGDFQGKFIYVLQLNVKKYLAIFSDNVMSL